MCKGNRNDMVTTLIYYINSVFHPELEEEREGERVGGPWATKDKA